MIKFVVVLVLCCLSTEAQAQRQHIRIENPLAVARHDETVSIPWRATSARVIEPLTGRELTTQLLGDSLLFQVNIGANEVREYIVEAAPPAGPPASRVHAKFVPEREDVAWESDRIAFRIYGKKLWELENLHTNGIDVWPKRTRNLVLDAWYATGHDSYHIDTGEGADFFQVGTTLGAGGVGIWHNHQLHRGDNFLAHRIIADGPIRAIFELEYGTIDAGAVRAIETKRVSIDAGSHFFHQQSSFTTNADTLAVAVGLVKRPGMVGSTSNNREYVWLAAWGPIENRTRGHGDLGTAVLIRKATVIENRELSDHYVVIGRATAAAPLVSYVGAGWTASRDFDDVEDWWRHVDEFAQRLAAPLVVTVAQ
jgi:pectinesterase